MYNLMQHVGERTLGLKDKGNRYICPQFVDIWLNENTLITGIANGYISGTSTTRKDARR